MFKRIIDTIERWSVIAGYVIPDTKEILTSPNFAHIQKQIDANKPRRERKNKRTRLTKTSEDT